MEPGHQPLLPARHGGEKSQIPFWRSSMYIALVSAVVGAIFGVTGYAVMGAALGPAVTGRPQLAQHSGVRWSSTAEFDARHEIPNDTASTQGHVPEKYNHSTSGIDGFLIDLDGTMYNPNGLIEGAQKFFSFLKDSQTPYVFLSNTGSKTGKATQKKFASGNFKLEAGEVPLENIWTAAEAQMDMMTDRNAGIPESSSLFVISGFQNGSELLDELKSRNSDLVNTWTTRTSLSTRESLEWGRKGASGDTKAYVVMFHDGRISPTFPDFPNDGTSEDYEKDWSFDLINKACAILLTGKGSLVYTADDPFNPSAPAEFAPLMYPKVGPGMIAALFEKGLYPADKSRTLQAGKGGVLGAKFMMDKAIELLKKQGHSGDKSKIAMVGDRYDTDIRGGVSVGIKTILVESGVHTHGMQRFYPADPATYYAPNVGDLVLN